MSALSYLKVKDICKPIGRPEFALDFGVDTCEIDPNDIKLLIGKKVYLSASQGEFSSGSDNYLTITDISATKIYGRKGRYAPSGPIVEVDIADVQTISWSETISKRIAVVKSAGKN